MLGSLAVYDGMSRTDSATQKVVTFPDPRPDFPPVFKAQGTSLLPQLSTHSDPDGIGLPVPLPGFTPSLRPKNTAGRLHFG